MRRTVEERLFAEPKIEDPKQVQRFTDLMQRYHVSLVLAGHTHFPGHYEAGGVPYAVAGAAGNFELRRQIARYLGSARGLNCLAEDIIITTGTRHSIDLCLRALTRAGDKVWTEEPGYAGAEELLALHGLVPVPVPVDRKGFRVESAEEIASDVRLCIVTPSHQSPLGVRLSFERRQRLLAWANRMDGYIIEDDYDG